MKDTTLAIRYAKAYLELASERGSLEEAVRGAAQAAGFLEGSGVARKVLFSPLVPPAGKASAIVRVLGGDIPARTREFVAFVIEKGRADVLPEILRQVELLDQQRRGVEHVEVVSAVALSDAQRQTLGERLKKDTGAREIVMQCSVDPALIGGLRVKAGDRVWDGSLSARLEQIRKKYE